ncbi:hypothetical protein [Hydrogenophaga laconesensis]|uniref:Diguanylate cyclase n=1 Tax=Hydrogenophaga laconesensis TaxID=1805971 RepID=A0ABU1VA21_9BURK|nr:hypothetical protein [Hydrogenophaga laconesensis]MDR7094311.1 hypothetical protein [Hydrogenophaga laconesensis]
MWRDLLMYGVLPLWVLGGLVEGWCHRRTHINAPASRRETAYHLTLLAQMGLGGLAALWLEINLAMLVLLLALFLLHEATHWLEIGRPRGTRELQAAERMAYSFLELLPLFTVLCLIALHGSQAGGWLDPREWQLRWKDEPLPPGYVLTLCTVIALFHIVPRLEDTVRHWRAGSPGASLR